MNMLMAALFVIVMVGCAHKGVSTTQSVHTCPPAETMLNPQGWELVPSATYTASQTPDTVMIKAMGENPTAGYEVKIGMSPLRIYPPQFLLYRKKPDGMVAQVVTPFEVCASFKAGEAIKSIIISDAGGRHEVTVDQARD